jgi:hypothetical protein
MKERGQRIAWITGDDSYLPIIKEINEAPDRSAAIVAVAFIEMRLTALIKQRMIDDAAVKDRLLGRDGAIGQFAVKADLGYLFGLYSEDVKDDLKTLANVRNAFAHQPDQVCFDSDEMVSKTDPLIHIKQLLVVDSRTRRGFKEPRDRFLFTVGHILNTLHAASLVSRRAPSIAS